jgi:predicted AAA+ superfamily ATPase
MSSRFRWLSTILPRGDGRRLVTVTGPRQAGKTTLVRATYPGLRYVNLDDADARDRLRAVRATAWADEIGPAVLDEAQKEPGLFEKVKFSYDAGAVDFTVLLGSSRILLLDQVRETLAGRVFLYDLWPLMPSELSHAADDAPKPPLLDRLLRATASISRALAKEPERLFPADEAPQRAAIAHLERWGGMPELFGLSDDDRRRWLSSYQQTYLERDLVDIVHMRDPVPFRALQQLAMLRTGQMLSYADVARDAKVSPLTARRYVGHLTTSYQFILVPPYHRNLTSSVVKSPKLYCTDMGLLRHGTQQWGQATGAMFDTLVVVEIQKWIATMGVDARLTYYRTRSGLEIDLLITTPEGVLGVEVKNRPDALPTDATGMKSVAEALGKEWLGGVVVHRGDGLHPLIQERDIWAVPVHRLF